MISIQRAGAELLEDGPRSIQVRHRLPFRLASTGDPTGDQLGPRSFEGHRQERCLPECLGYGGHGRIQIAIGARI